MANTISIECQEIERELTLHDPAPPICSMYN